MQSRYCGRQGEAIGWKAGYKEAERAVVAFLPEYLQETQEETNFPICLLQVKVKGSAFGKQLTHRDYLGSLMALRIQREMIGDILVQPTGAYLFLIKRAAVIVLREWKQVGSHGITVAELPLAQAELAEGEKEELRIFVASMRLDTIVAEGSRYPVHRRLCRLKQAGISAPLRMCATGSRGTGREM